MTYKSERSTEYSFIVDVIREGQPRPYADSDYEYVITSNLGEWVVKRFCTSVLLPCKQEKKDWKPYSEDASSFFYGYYEFTKTATNTYRYHVHKPFCD